MEISKKIDRWHSVLRSNKWAGYFTIFVRFALALGFLPSGFVKITGDRFTVLTTMHPMGHYLDAVYRTGFYYTVIGITQVTAAILLLIPRTALLGALMYFPVILNICLVSLSVRFEGSLLSSPLMVLANFYLLFWDYHRLKFIFPWNYRKGNELLPARTVSRKFPYAFFASGLFVVALIVLLVTKGFDVVPRNTMKDCLSQCPDKTNVVACETFCDCIHKQGQSLDSCLKVYNKIAGQK